MSEPLQSETINELAGALAKAQGEMDHAKKDAANPFFKSKYADLASVMDAARPHLAKHGLSVTQMPLIRENGTVLLVTQLMHSSGQWLRNYWPVNPVKPDPQGFGSALTYSRRYAYSSLVGVAADDDDGNAASNPEPKNGKQQQPRKAPVEEPPPEEPLASLSEEENQDWIRAIATYKTAAEATTAAHKLKGIAPLWRDDLAKRLKGQMKLYGITWDKSLDMYVATGNASGGKPGSTTPADAA